MAHDYFTQRGGAERVALTMCDAFDTSFVYTLLHNPLQTYPEVQGLSVTTSPLNRIKSLRLDHRRALPLLPAAASGMYVDADVMLASSSGWAHGFRTSGRKVVYCYSPARWLYDSKNYLGVTSSPSRRYALGALRRPLIAWDRAAARSADRYIAISSAVRDRIWQRYRISSSVLGAPRTLDPSGSRDPIELPSQFATDGYVLCVSRLLPYKRVDLVIAACRKVGISLAVVGSGPEIEHLRKLGDDGVAFLSGLTDGQMRSIYANCRAVVSASYEDFGLSPVEGYGFGRPAVTPADGGFADTGVHGRTGLQFQERHLDQFVCALRATLALTWDESDIKAYGEKFAPATFKAELRKLVL